MKLPPGAVAVLGAVAGAGLFGGLMIVLSLLGSGSIAVGAISVADGRYVVAVAGVMAGLFLLWLSGRLALLFGRMRFGDTSVAFRECSWPHT